MKKQTFLALVVRILSVSGASLPIPKWAVLRPRHLPAGRFVADEKKDSSQGQGRATTTRKAFEL